MRGIASLFAIPLLVACGGQDPRTDAHTGPGGVVDPPIAEQGGSAGSQAEMAPLSGGAGGDAPIPNEPSVQSDAGAGGAGGAQPEVPVSRFCGDGIRDPKLEECDDGSSEQIDGCDDTCHVRWQEWLPAASPPAGAAPNRTLGAAPHVAASSGNGFAVVYVESASRVQLTTVMLSLFDAAGHRSAAPLNVADDFAPTSQSQPVVAGLGAGRYAVAWTDGRDGTPDIRLRLIAPDAEPIDAMAHKSASGPQVDADLLWTGTSLLVAWTDLLDVRVRRFDEHLRPLEADRIVAPANEIQSKATLSQWGDSFAVGFIANSEDPCIRVVSDGLTWCTPLPSGPFGDRLALTPIDSRTLLLVFSSPKTVSDDQSGEIQELRAALLDRTMPGVVDSFVVEASARAQRRPSAVRAGEQTFLTWEEEGALLRGVQVLATDSGPQFVPLPQGSAAYPSTRSNAHLVALTFGSAAALLQVWESKKMRDDPALAAELWPIPFITAPQK